MKQESSAPKRKADVGDAIDNAGHTYGILGWIHPPTATALSVGATGGAFLAFLLFVKWGLVAIAASMIAGAVLGAFVGLVLYWGFRLFSFTGE